MLFGIHYKIVSVTCRKEKVLGSAQTAWVVPIRLILDMHTFNLHLLVTCQNHVCDFQIARNMGVWAGILGESSHLLVSWCVEKSRARAWSRSI